MGATYKARITGLDAIAVMVVHSKHGSFLKSFADAWLRADRENKILLWPIWENLIQKYDLTDELVAVFS